MQNGVEKFFSFNFIRICTIWMFWPCVYIIFIFYCIMSLFFVIVLFSFYFFLSRQYSTLNQDSKSTKSQTVKILLATLIPSFPVSFSYFPEIFYEISTKEINAHLGSAIFLHNTKFSFLYTLFCILIFLV